MIIIALNPSIASVSVNDAGGVRLGPGEIIFTLGAIGFGFGVHILVLWLLRRAASRSGHDLPARARHRISRPSLALFPLAGVLLVLTLRGPHAYPFDVVHQWLFILVILLFTWLIIASISVIDDVILMRFDVSVSDNLRARKVHTKTRVISRTLMIIVGVAGVGLAMMTYPEVRRIGVSMLASAGIAGIVIGIAAAPMLGNLIAGIQIAITQPISLDDVVILEGEWGRIEEITATYVVIRIWDERRLIVPLRKFIEEPFQNWTRTSADILGTVFLHTDYRVPLAPLRDELRRLCEASDRWDGRVCLLQVTDATDRTIQLRALVSASGSGILWDLRCEIREGLLSFLQREHPESLPVVRISSEAGKGGAIHA